MSTSHQFAAVFTLFLILNAGTACKSPEPPPAWSPAEGRIMTRWAADVDPVLPHPDYPRPQMVRNDWMNLNGLWEYAIRPAGDPEPEAYDGHILVPFPVESALSGVKKAVGPDNRLWYRRTFRLPKGWDAKRILINFEAVDWETRVSVNGIDIGTHRGGYNPFSFDVTDALRKRGEQTLVLSVWDPVDAGTQPRGKQVREPRSIWYTSVTGIWATVWIEPVDPEHIRSLRIIPDIDAEEVRIQVEAAGGERVKIAILSEGVTAGNAQGRPGDIVALAVPDPKLWSPESPFLYDLSVELLDANGHTLDRITSYFGMRKTSLGRDEAGRTRLFLNNAPLFQFGPLDQGWWPDGLYAAPTDEALQYDIEALKDLGFNMMRKHVKVEPRRFYTMCDRLGLLVWQDMPNGDAFIGSKDPDLVRSEESARQFEAEFASVIKTLINHPSIVMWVPFNEGWGQYDTARITDWVKILDPTRLVNSASGWTDRGTGDVNDIHRYPGPDAPPNEPGRAAVLGEFGGLGLPVSGHTWQDEKNWGYRSYTNTEELTAAYIDLIAKLKPFIRNGLSAAVYTQTTDVEIEVNGLLTYDRAIVKMDREAATAANRSVYAAAPAGKAQDLP
ncbi:MAG: glycoside hydrolase family 2 TIM barrel-domain containing protein [Acidobacteriota bacterium]|nr:glycoside hydrolase family 2 TIM barrel-domain containing protein [Acidobacteriota bacterium]